MTCVKVIVHLITLCNCAICCALCIIFIINIKPFVLFNVFTHFVFERCKNCLPTVDYHISDFPQLHDHHFGLDLHAGFYLINDWCTELWKDFPQCVTCLRAHQGLCLTVGWPWHKGERCFIGSLFLQCWITSEELGTVMLYELQDTLGTCFIDEYHPTMCSWFFFSLHLSPFSTDNFRFFSFKSSKRQYLCNTMIKQYARPKTLYIFLSWQIYIYI